MTIKACQHRALGDVRPQFLAFAIAKLASYVASCKLGGWTLRIRPIYSYAES